MNRDEFVERYGAFMKRAVEISLKTRREGLFALDEVIDRKKVSERDIFEYGLQFAYDGTDPGIIEKTLGNIIAQEKDEYTRLYKTIQKEAVLGIQQGHNAKTLYTSLNSLTDLPWDDAFLQPEDAISDGALSQKEVDEMLSSVDAFYAGIKEGEGTTGIFSPADIECLLKAIKAEPVAAGASLREKFSRKHLRAISIIHEKFASLAANSLSAKLHIPVNMKIAAVDQCTLDEFIRILPSPASLGIINMEPLKGSAVLEIDPAITPERIVGSLLENLREAWSPIMELHPRLDKIETDPQCIKIAPLEECVALVTFEAKTEGVERMINFCIPYPAIGPILEKLLTLGSSPVRKKISSEGGIVFEGDTVDGKPHGKGKVTFPDGTICEGDFADGKFSGKGKKTFPDGASYEGDFLDGDFHGKGKCIGADGTSDEGDFVNNVLHGKGKRTYNDGSIYIGDFVGGLRQGKGKATYAGGDVYEGDYAGGNPHGKGKYTWADDGTVYEGDFAAGNFHGKAKVAYPDGRVYLGDYANDKRNGQGKMTYPDGKVEDGEWKDGEFTGK